MKTSSIRIVIFGPEGSGKTTLMHALNTAIRDKATVGLETTFRPTEQFVCVKSEVAGSGARSETWDLKDTAAKEPVAPATVPLGPNVTRDSREVVVLEIQKDHVVGVVKNVHEWTVAIWPLNGRGVGVHSCAELVGHLPPEPPKPRELWLLEDHDGGDRVAWDTPQQIAPHRKQTHFREVIEP